MFSSAYTAQQELLAGNSRMIFITQFGTFLAGASPLIYTVHLAGNRMIPPKNSDASDATSTIINYCTTTAKPPMEWQDQQPHLS